MKLLPLSANYLPHRRSELDSMILRKLLTILGIFVILSSSFAQRDDNIKIGTELYKNGEYRQALSYLNSPAQSLEVDTDVEMMKMDCYFQTAQYQDAILIGTNLINTSSKVNNDVYYLMGKSLHRSGLFEEAIKTYKDYLNKSKRKNRKDEITDEIKRAWKGKVYLLSPRAVIVENLGRGVNSAYDETAPMVSVNHENRIYFSSNTTGYEGQNDYEIYGTEITRGVWASREPLGGLMNSADSEVLQDFSKDGRIAIVKKGGNEDLGSFYVDSLDKNFEQLKRWDIEFLFGEEGDKDFRFVNDSTCLFSSRREGGYGGYDLYVAFYKLGKWKIQNLGEQINGPYDEVAPCLAPDGNTLFFSSNDVQSMGGYDLFYSVFGQDLEWTKKKNMSQPFNSGADDQEIRWSADGTTAYFASNRTGGYGGYDIYSALLREPMFETEVQGRVFIDRKEYESFRSSFVEGSGSLLTEFEIKPIYFDNMDAMLTTNNRKELDKLIAMLKSYPHLSVTGICHTNSLKIDLFDMYYSLQKVEEVAQYMIREGVPARKVNISSVGGNYPFCLRSVNGQSFEAAQKFNNRIDWYVYGGENLPLTITRQKIDIPEMAINAEGKEFYEDADGMVFRVNYIEMEGLFKGEIAYDFDHPIILKNFDSQYIYTTDETNNFSKVYDTYLQVKEKGFANAKILAFLNGRQLRQTDMTTELLTEYPELKKFLLYLE